jgi:hypothetical protein
VNGCPAIAHNNAFGNLWYTRALDADGTGWGTTIEVVPEGPALSGFASMQVVNGRPAIAYHDSVGSRLRFVRSTGSNGNAWGAPVSPDPGGGVHGYGASMAIVDGFPAISYTSSTNELRYVRSQDADGLLWSAPVVVSSNAQSDFTSLSVLTGRPAIAFTTTAPAVGFAWAKDIDGATWPALPSIVAGSDYGYNLSMAVVGDVPIIEWHQNATLVGQCVAQPVDASAAMWTTKGIAPLISINLNSKTCLTDINGAPAISTADGATSLRFLRLY